MNVLGKLYIHKETYKTNDISTMRYSKIFETVVRHKPRLRDDIPTVILKGNPSIQ
jgi:hypothetical protein